MNAITTYTDELDAALVRAGVPADRRQQVLAEVVAHVRDTGEDPVDAFGAPAEYAHEYAAVDALGAAGATTAAGASTTGTSPAAPAIPAPIPVVVQVVLALLGLLVCVPGLLMLLGLTMAVGQTPATVLLAWAAGLLALVGLAVVTHRRVARRPTWWSQLLVALGALGAIGAWILVCASTGFSTVGGWSECDPSGHCVDHDTSTRWLGMHVQNALALAGAVAYVGVCLALLTRTRRRERG